jgi:hypothetical protein
VIGTEQYEITAYLYAVRAALGDLPEATRDELLEDLPEHLAEVLAEAGGTLVERLGPPETYAAELRASIGFVGGFPDPPQPAPLVETWRAVRQRLGVLDVRLGPLLGYERASEFAILLRPAWWVLRGYLLAMVIAWMLDDSGQPMGLLPRIGGSELVALLLIAGAVVGSIWLGRRSFRSAERWPQWALYAGSAVLVLVAIGGFLNADRSTRGGAYTDANYNGGNPYSGVQDVFVYDQQGRLVTGAQIFDQDGSPIELGNPYCTDETTGDYAHTNHMGYPYCPERAPFAPPSDERSASAGPSAAVGSLPVPTPPASRSAPR